MGTGSDGHYGTWAQEATGIMVHGHGNQSALWYMGTGSNGVTGIMGVMVHGHGAQRAMYMGTGSKEYYDTWARE